MRVIPYYGCSHRNTDTYTVYTVPYLFRIFITYAIQYYVHTYIRMFAMDTVKTVDHIYLRQVIVQIFMFRVCLIFDFTMRSINYILRYGSY